MVWKEGFYLICSLVVVESSSPLLLITLPFPVAEERWSQTGSPVPHVRALKTWSEIKGT